MTLHVPFDNSFARLPEGFFAALAPTPVAAPSLIAFNHALAAQLNIVGDAKETELARLFSGNALPEGASPLAQLYAGHQFGQFNPQLGDGRALLLGEVVDDRGTRFDIQLKGSGPTPFSRMGDGRAWLGPVLREYLVSEAMAALGVPTTRALAAVRSGETVVREAPLPGAVLTRVAQSHIRVGTFQIFAARREYAHLQQLLDYTIARHAPEASGPLGLLHATIAKQADLVTRWLSIGFVHGVMNTDNCTLSGETIDYGPCAFLDHFDANMVFSSIDRFGRYAYSAQTDIIVWNMAQLANALLALEDDPEQALPAYQSAIEGMPDLIRGLWLDRFAAKIGIAAPKPEDAVLLKDLLDLMQAGGSDFTNSFAALRHGSAKDEIADRAGYESWHARWQARLEGEDTPEAVMARANPIVIPRNHRIEEAIAAAVVGDDAPFHRLHAALARPYDTDGDADWLTAPPSDQQRVKATFCGT